MGMKASEFDKKFDDGESILPELDIIHAQRTKKETKQIPVMDEENFNLLLESVIEGGKILCGEMKPTRSRRYSVDPETGEIQRVSRNNSEVQENVE